ncbi:hypothetical protein [Caenimonas koreensis]|uniref:hypothetical protein n=1 Tax=Caenimonas koreensis TaxID=367474 RepID=UPI0037841A34
MNTRNTTANSFFPRRDASGALHIALFAAAAGLTAVMWLSAFGAGTQPRGYVAEMMAQAPLRVQLPRVEIVGNRSAIAGLDASEVACAADRNHKPG